MAELLGPFEQAVLLAVNHCADDAYGTPIRQRVSHLLNRQISIGALYSTLGRLEKKGLISSRQGEATKVRGGRAKRYFRIEAPGIRALGIARETTERLWRSSPVLA